MDADTLFINQTEIYEALNKLLINTKKDGADRKTITAYRRKLEVTEAYWQNYLANHNKLCESTRDHIYFEKGCFAITNGVYQSLKSIVEKTIDQLTKTQQLGLSPRGPALEPQTSPGTSTNQPSIAHRKIDAEAAQMRPGTRSQHEEIPQSVSVPSSNLHNLIRKQRINFKALERTVSKTLIDKFENKWQFENALKSLESRWGDIDKLHWEIEAENGGDESEYQEEFCIQEESYNELIEKINMKMWSVKHRESSAPKMSIPVFNGSYDCWVSFKDLFTEAIDKNPSLSSAQKMQFLKGKVTGEAERLIHHLPISSENYQVSWEILNHRYGNKKLIFTTHINTLLGIPNMTQQSLPSIKKLHGVAKETLHAITNLGVDIATWDPLLVHLLAQKLDDESFTEYVESIKKPRELPALQEFLDYLEIKFTALEASCRKQGLANQKPTTSKNNSNENKKGFHNRHANSNYKETTKSSANTFHVSRSSTCVLCNDEHGLWKCPQFLNMTTTEKLQKIKQLDYCDNCLSGHSKKQCQSKKRCRKCLKSHNTLLHDALVGEQSASASNNSDTVTQDASVVTKESSTRSSNASWDDASEILLATAVIRITGANGIQHEMRALVDQGSQLSLINEKAAQVLGLKRSQFSGQIFGVGEKENNAKGFMDITLQSNHSDFSLCTSVVIMNNLIKKLPNNSFTTPTSWNYIKGLQLADPQYNVSRPVDLLLGADVYSKIMLGGILRGDKDDQPLAQQTQLGWLLCGSTKPHYHCNVVLNNTEDLLKFWENEDISQDIDMSNNDHECLQYFINTTKRRTDGKYEVRLPFKPTLKDKLGATQPEALAQFRNLERKSDKLTVNLVAAKARLGPLSKSLSIPRLELIGAQLLTQLMLKVQSCLADHQLNTYCWTDSTAVLGWIQGDSARWKPFVANCVTSITNRIPGEHWRYVKTSENPADCASRGLTVTQLKNHSLWWNGPSWLQSQYIHQENQSKHETTLELKPSFVNNVLILQHSELLNDLLTKFSSITKIIRIIAWILRMSNCKNRVRQPYLELQELRRAKMLIMKNVQQEQFADDVNSINKHGKVQAKSKILNLNPFKDKEGIIRTGGRSRNANVSIDKKHPIILPQNHRLTTLLIEQAHHLTLHGGARFTLANLRQRYWIIGGYVATKKHIRRCVIRTKHNPVRHNQLIGYYPESRLNPDNAKKWKSEYLVQLSKTVSLKTKNGFMKRPIVKLSVLPVHQDNQPDTKPKPVTNIPQPKAKTKIATIATVLLSLMMLISPTYSLHEIKELPSNQTLYFDPISKIQLIRDKWALVVYYDMGPYWTGIGTYAKISSYLDKLCATIQQQSHCNTIIQQARHDYQELEYYNELLLTQHFDVHARHRRYITQTEWRRSRRGLIDGIGYLANDLFGVLDSRFADQYVKDIETIHRNEKHLTNLWKNQTSIIEAEFNLMKKMESTIDRQHKLVNRKLMELQDNTSVLQREIQNISYIQDFTLSAMAGNSLLHSLRRLQDTLLDTITDVYHGQISMHLLTPNQLKNELLTINGQMPSDLKLPINNIETDFQYLYKLLKVKARATQKYVIIEITFPLIGRETYQLYKLIPIPHQTNTSMTEIIPISEYVAVNLEKDDYFSLSTNELSACLQHGTTYMCQVLKPIRHIKKDEDFCEINTSMNMCKSTKNTCSDKWIELHSPSQHLYFCCDIYTIKIICDDRVTIRQLSRAGVIGMSQDCIIKGKDFAVYSIRHHSNQINITPTIHVPEFDQINHLVNLQLPEDSTTYQDEHLNASLTRLGESIQNLKNSNVEMDDLSYHDIHHYALGYAILACLVIASLVWMWRSKRCCRRRRSASEHRSSRCSQDAEAASPPPQRPRRRRGSHQRHEPAETSAPPRPTSAPPPPPSDVIISASDLNKLYSASGSDQYKKQRIRFELNNYAKRWPNRASADNGSTVDQNQTDQGLVNDGFGTDETVF